MVTSPAQKALLQFVESMVITALIAGIASISNLLIGNGQINWTQAGITFGFAVVFSLAHSLSAYLKAIPAAQDQPDLSGLGNVLDAFLANLEQRLNAVKAPVASTTVTVQPPAQAQVQQAPAPAQPAQIDWSATNPAFKAVNLVPPAQQ